MATGNAWARVSVPVTVSSSSDQLEFRIQWHGAANMDASAIRVR
jgi:hypothetical protein